MSDRESRIDETARAWFVGQCLKVSSASDAYVRSIAASAYTMATILEEARPVPDAATARPLAVGDRVRGLGGWTGTRGAVIHAFPDGRIVVKCDFTLGSTINGPASEWEREP